MVVFRVVFKPGRVGSGSRVDSRSPGLAESPGLGRKGRELTGTGAVSFRRSAVYINFKLRTD